MSALLVCSLKRNEHKIKCFNVQCASLYSDLPPPFLPSPGKSFPYTYISQEMSESFIVPLACNVALGSHPRKKDFHSLISTIYCIPCSIFLSFSFSAFYLSALKNCMIDINIFSLIKIYFPLILVLVIHYSVFLLNKSHWLFHYSQ